MPNVAELKNGASPEPSLAGDGVMGSHEELSQSNKLSAIDLQQVYEIGFSDGRRGPWKRKTLMLASWAPEQQRCYDKGHMDGRRQQLLDSQEAPKDPMPYSRSAAERPSGGDIP